MQSTFLKRNYRTYLTVLLPSTSIGEIEITLNDSTESNQGFILLEPGTENEESIFYHRRVGNTVYCYGVNRSNPVVHSINAPVLMANSIDYMNRIIAQIHDQSYIYKKSTSHIIITGGSFYVGGENIMIADVDTSAALTGKSLAVNTTNYIYLKDGDYFITSTADSSLILIGTVLVALDGTITDIEKFNTMSFAEIGPRGLKGDKGIIWRGVYSGATAYIADDVVHYNGSSYICILATTGNIPTNTTYWNLVAQKGNDGVGVGDMLTGVYDPNEKNADAFSMDNMDETATKKILSDSERTLIATIGSKAPLNNPAFTGNPTVPTQSQGDNSTKIANTEYVRTALANLIASSPTALDTLNELAIALGNDANFATTITNALAGKVSLTANEVIDGLKTFTSPLITNGAINFNAPEGFMVNGKIVPSVANLIANNSFETDLSGWSGWLSTSFTRVTSQFFHGTASAQIITDGSTYAQGCYSAVTTKVGSTYAYSCYVKGTAGKQITMLIDGGTFPEIYQTLTGGWDRITGSVIATTTNTSIFIQCKTAGVTTYWVDAVQVEEGTSVAGPFTTTQGNLTLTLTGTSASLSATNPCYVMIGGVTRTITSDLVVVVSSGASVLNSGSSELATKEIDFFTHLFWYDTATPARVGICIARLPIVTDLGISYLDEKGIYYDYDGSHIVSATTPIVNIGRFAATLSAGAGYTWSIPTYTASNLIQRPIYETRVLQGGSQTGWTANNLLFYYKIRCDSLEFSFDANGTSNSTSSYITLPFSAKTIMAHDFALGLTYDNGVDLTTPGRADLYGQYCNLYKDSAYGVWTASGAKIVRGQGHYYI